MELYTPSTCFYTEYQGRGKEDFRLFLPFCKQKGIWLFIFISLLCENDFQTHGTNQRTANRKRDLMVCALADNSFAQALLGQAWPTHSCQASAGSHRAQKRLSFTSLALLQCWAARTSQAIWLLGHCRRSAEDGQPKPSGWLLGLSFADNGCWPKPLISSNHRIPRVGRVTQRSLSPAPGPASDSPKNPTMSLKAQSKHSLNSGRLGLVSCPDYGLPLEHFQLSRYM